MIRAVPILGDSVVIGEPQHLTALALVALVSIVLAVALRRTRGGRHEHVVRRRVCWSLGAVVIAAVVFSQVHQLVIGTWSVQESLPLHLCDVGLFVVAAALFGLGASPPRGTMLWQRCFELSYYWGVGGTTQALVTPDTVDTFPGLSCIRYFITHGSIIVGVAVMMLGLGMRPRPDSAPRAWVITLGAGLVVFAFDALTGANYMYLLGPPQNPTLYDAFGPWPWALLGLAAFGTVMIHGLYLPFLVADWVGKQRREGRSRE